MVLKETCTKVTWK